MHAITAKMKTLLQVLSIVAATVAVSNATTIKKCKGESAPSIDDIKIQLGNCTDGQCELFRGETYGFEQHFKAIKNTDNVQSMAVGLKYGHALRLSSGRDPEACKSISDSRGKKGACPLKKGESYVYNTSIKIRENEGKISLDVEWHLVDKDESITCFQIPIKIS